MCILEANNIYRFYHTEFDETLALQGISLSVNPGEMVALMGPSGSGKSTLLSCLCGIDEPDGGYVCISGARLTRKSESHRAAARVGTIGVLMQSGNLLDHLTVKENIYLKMWLNHNKDTQKASELLELVGLTGRENAYPSQISGGETARAAIAVVLSTNPQILLADEPTSEVDTETESKIIQLFRHFCQNGGAAVIATHSENLASYANRIIKLHDGRVIDDGRYIY
jgi:putative ABC transport system ATP-binding protein